MPISWNLELEPTRADDHVTEASRFPGLPGRRTLTSRLAPSAASIARAVVARLEGGGGPPAIDGPAAAAAVARAAAAPGEPLPDRLRGELEQALGVPLDGVRTHRDADSAAAARALHARAFTVGQDVHFAPDAYQPDSARGRHLIAHEVAHTVQQRGQAPGPQAKLEVSVPGDAAELEADAFADDFLAGDVRSRPREGSASGIARTEECEAESTVAREQLETNRGIARQRITQARQEADQLRRQAEQAIRSIERTALRLVADVDRWRASVDQAALARLETDYDGAIIDGIHEIVDRLAELHPVTKLIWLVVGGALDVAGLVSAIDEVGENRARVQAGQQAASLATGARNEILRGILRLQHAASSAVDVLHGRIRGEADGFAADGDAERERQQLRGGGECDERGLRRGAVEDAEGVGAGSLDAADRVDGLMNQLRLATERLTAAPGQIEHDGRRRLVAIQTTFSVPERQREQNQATGGWSEVQLRGLLSAAGDVAYLTVDRQVGQDEHQTSLDRGATLRDVVRAPAHVHIEFSSPPGLWIGFGTRPMVWSLEPAALAFALGLAHDSVGPNTRPRERAMDAGVPGGTDDAGRIGRRVQERVEQALIDRPLADLNGATIDLAARDE